MQGPPVNVVLLGLLILFFGMQLRGRRERPYSGWLLGWLLIFLSYMIWECMPLVPTWSWCLELARADLLTLGIAAFLLSFLLPQKGLGRMLGWSSLVLGPLLVLIDMQLVAKTPRPPSVGLTVAGTLVSIFVVHKLVPRLWMRRRALLDGLCVLTAVWLIAAGRMHPAYELQEVVQSPMLIGVAVLYMASSRSRMSVRILGGVGFLLWAEFYIFADMLRDSPQGLSLFYEFWDLPKYSVGVAMILDLFEAGRITTERLAKRYRLLYENLDMLYEGHPHPMWIYEASTRLILSANAAAVKSYGYSMDELVGMATDALETPGPDEEDAMRLGPTSPTSVFADSRRALHRHKSGHLGRVDIVERKLIYEGKDARIVLAVDITEQEKVHQDLFYRAHHDPLTQLPNRELLADRVAQVIAGSERDSRCAVLLTIDVDHFKQINDTHGHPAGDECLKLIANRLRSRIRQVDTLARTGGEEFTAIIGGLTRRQDAAKIAESLRRLFDEPLVLEDRTLQASISIGGALYPEDGIDLETLRKRSDEALYIAKRMGRNRCVLSSTEVEQAPTDFAGSSAV